MLFLTHVQCMAELSLGRYKKVLFAPAEDGSGKGAALVVAAAS